MTITELSGRNFEIDDKLHAYVDEKIGGLDKYLPRRLRAEASLAIILQDDPSGREDNRYVCDAVLTVLGTKMVSQEGTVNIYAAIDIVEAKLKSQLIKFKEKQVTQPRRLRRLTSWIGKRTGAEMPVESEIE